MSKDFIPLGVNNIPFDNAINKLYKVNKVVESSQKSYFNKLPDRREITEIEVGSSGT